MANYSRWDEPDMGLAIRELGLADAAMVGEMLDVVSPGWADALAPGASGAIAFVADPPSFMFGAYVDHKPVGWLWGVHVHRPDGRVMSYVHQIDVVETQRRKGIASLLVESAIDAARRRGSHRLWLITEDTNDGARSLYDSLGGQNDGAGRIYRWDL